MPISIFITAFVHRHRWLAVRCPVCVVFEWRTELGSLVVIGRYE